MDLILAIALMVVFALVGAGGGYFYRKNMAEKRIGRTEEYAKKLLDDATRKAAILADWAACRSPRGYAARPFRKSPCHLPHHRPALPDIGSGPRCCCWEASL